MDGATVAGDDGYHVAIVEEMPSPLFGEAVFVEVILLSDDPAIVDEAFVNLSDPTLRLTTCSAGVDTLPCSHELLSMMDPLASGNLRLERLGRSSANVEMFALDDVADADNDTFPVGCPDSAACLAELTDCSPGTIEVNPFELEAAAGVCIDGLDQDCSGEDGPCFDIDGDGFTEPVDCGEGDINVNPGIIENDSANCSDGIDNDCTGGDVACACDMDGDGFCTNATGGLPGGDCCETGAEPGCPMGADPATINPGVPELCGNGEDENCDGMDGLCAPADADGDGQCAQEYDCNTTEPLCQLLRATVDVSVCTNFFDCADWDSSIFMGATEDCGGVDRDCDGDIGTCAADADGDGIAPPTDCDDTNPAVNPDAGEVCGNGLDDDCVGGDVPCNASTDADGDTYADCPVGVTTGCDCDPTDPDINPGADETCDDVDQNCDGFIDNGVPEFADAFLTPLPCWGNPINDPSLMFMEVTDGLCQVGLTACSAGVGTCILFVRPAAVETCNGLNDTCMDYMPGPGEANVPDDEQDLDGDGYLAGCMPAGGLAPDCCDGPADPSCDPNQIAVAAMVNDGANETCSDPGVDNDCDGNAMENECPSDEMCVSGSTCACGSMMSSGEACDTADAPACVMVGMALTCGCDTDLVCDGDETCNGTECTCGAAASMTGPACPAGTPNPICDGTSCACATGVVCDADETCNGGDCECGMDISSVGPACPDMGPNPTCNTMTGMCMCDTDSVCGSGETCDGMLGACTCGPAAPLVGEACTDPANPECVSGACACDGNSTCDVDEICMSGSCTCGMDSSGSGEACSSPDNPVCNGMQCVCDANSICDSDELCDEMLGTCNCGTTSTTAGEACPSPAAPNCMGGACACDSDSMCDADETCMGGACTCGSTGAPSGTACGALPAAACIGGLCDCDGAAGPNPPCMAGETCNGGGNCM